MVSSSGRKYSLATTHSKLRDVLVCSGMFGVVLNRLLPARLPDVGRSVLGGLSDSKVTFYASAPVKVAQRGTMTKPAILARRING